MKKLVLPIIIIPVLIISLFFFMPKKELKPENIIHNKAQEMLDKMSTEEKVGQMFMVRTPLKDGDVMVSKYHLGGYILFARDFKDKAKEEVINDIKQYQSKAKIPLLIGVDEEGGSVNRISKYPEFRDTPYKSSQEIYRESGYEGIIEDTIDKANLLKSLGININLAPVADTSTNESDYIYKRTFGKNALETSTFVKTVVDTMKNENMGSTLKHFPGYGGNLDTHTGMSVDDRSYENFQKNDFLPFKAGIEAGANMVMVSHNIVKSMDPDNPASLSKNVHKILREELKFNGVIITDDLYMDAIKKFAGEKEVAVMAVLAGNDLICATDFEKQIPAVIDAVKNGKIKIEQINESVLRILKMKMELGLL